MLPPPSYFYMYIYKECSGLLLVHLDRFQVSIDYSNCRMSQQKKKFNILLNKWEHQMLSSRNWTPDINVNNPVCIGTLLILLHIPLLSFDVACDVDTLNFIDESVMSHSIKCIWKYLRKYPWHLLVDYNQKTYKRHAILSKVDIYKNQKFWTQTD